MKDKFKKEWFNPLFYYLEYYLKQNEIREIYVYGGSSSAKTHSILQSLLLDGYYRDYSSIVYRKEQTAIKTTVKNECKSIIENLNLTQIKEYDFEFRYNSRELKFKGIDKEGKIKGLKGYRKLFFDEIDQFKEEEFNQAKLRLRGEDNQQLIFSWNPINENHWLKKYLDNFEWVDVKPLYTENHKKLHETSFIKRYENKILIKTTYLDNYWVVGGEWGRRDEHVINEFESLKRTNTALYNVYALGNWGVLRNDNPFFYSYTDKHYTNNTILILDNNYLSISFDFNKDPCTAVIGQYDHYNFKFRIFDVITANQHTMTGYSPLEAVCEMINKKYIVSGLFINSRILVTGDASGKSGGADYVLNASYYTTIQRKLKISVGQIYTRPKNLGHPFSGEIINYFLRTCDFIHNNQFLDDEIKIAYSDEKGTLNKAKEKHGLHTLDAFRYLIDFWVCRINNTYTNNFERIQKNIEYNLNRVA